MNELEYRQALRGLRVDRDPQRDLWPDIASRIDSPRRRHWLPLALAASAALFAVLVGRELSEPQSPVDGGAAPEAIAAQETILLREADVMILQYRAALAELAQSPLPLELRPMADQLDDGARQLRDALEDDPQSLELLLQLRRTYDQRLRLGQRAALG